ncbi:MAG: hypothetical protein H0U95_17845 [Bacteroidetes bacterium]|nr:hypothetical protein [Bacteroidota bacterium]
MGLDSVEIVVETEKRLGITISNKNAEKTEKVQELYDCAWKYVEAKQNADPSINKLSKKEVEEIVLQVLYEITGVEKEAITSEKSIASDLGID